VITKQEQEIVEEARKLREAHGLRTHDNLNGLPCEVLEGDGETT
jgi:hypothetical protein